jgi:hypothetical protein
MRPALLPEIVMVNAAQAFDAVIVDDVCVTETTSAEASTGDISSVMAARRTYGADLIESTLSASPYAKAVMDHALVCKLTKGLRFLLQNSDASTPALLTR